MGKLNAKLGVKQNALTQAADRLIARGLTERQQDAVDRRVVRLKFTDLGREWMSRRQYSLKFDVPRRELLWQP